MTNAMQIEDPVVSRGMAVVAGKDRPATGVPFRA